MMARVPKEGFALRRQRKYWPENQLNLNWMLRHGHCRQPNEKRSLPPLVLIPCTCWLSLLPVDFFFIFFQIFSWFFLHFFSLTITCALPLPCPLHLIAIGVFCVPWLQMSKAHRVERWFSCFPPFFPATTAICWLPFLPTVLSRNRGPNDAQSNFVVLTAFTDILMLWLLRFWMESFALQQHTRTWLYPIAIIEQVSGKAGEIELKSLIGNMLCVDPLTSWVSPSIVKRSGQIQNEAI